MESGKQKKPGAALSEQEMDRIASKFVNLMKKGETAEEPAFIDLEALGSPEERIAALEDLAKSLQGTLRTLRKDHDDLKKEHGDLLSAFNEVVEAIEAMTIPAQEKKPAVARLGAPKASSKHVPPESKGFDFNNLKDRFLGPKMQ